MTAAIPPKGASRPPAPATPALPVSRPVPLRGLSRWAPGLANLAGYRREWLAKDGFAGLVLTAILVPVGMGYAEAAGLPAICGLYASIVPLLAYAVFGPNRILVLGPDSALAALIAATVLPLAGGDTGRAIALAGALSILAGLLSILAGAARVGFITDLLSKPIRFGYLNGIGLTVLVGQLPKLLGFSVPGTRLVHAAAGVARGVAEGRVNSAACAIGLSSLAVILGLRRIAPRVPGVLIAVVAATGVVTAFDLAGRAGVPVVGALPQGLPAFGVPDVSLTDAIALGAGAAAIALLSFAEMAVLSRTFAVRGGYEVNTDQEFIALGAANVATGFLQGFPVSCSASRTPVAEAAGAKTQLTGVVGAVCISLLLIFAPRLLSNLPAAVLAAVVISAVTSFVEVRGALQIWKLRRSEFVFSTVCFLGVAFMGVIQGILVAVVMALLGVIWRVWRPYAAILGRVDGLKGYHDISRHPEGRRVPGLVLFRWDAPLFFANADIFRRQVLRAVADAPEAVRCVVVAAEPVTDVDVTAADALASLEDDLHRAGIELWFAEMKGPVKDNLKHYGLFARIGPDKFIPTIGQAVDRYVASYGVRWQDWEDRELDPET